MGFNLFLINSGCWLIIILTINDPGISLLRVGCSPQSENVILVPDSIPGLILTSKIFSSVIYLLLSHISQSTVVLIPVLLQLEQLCSTLCINGPNCWL